MLLQLCIVTCCALETKKTTAHGYVSIKDGKLFYQKFGSGKTIILLHGGIGLLDHSCLLPHILDFAHNWQLVLYDQRGSGRSKTILSNELINLNQFTADLETLRSSLKIEQFILMGHSWGALVALNYASIYKNRVSKLVVFNTAPFNYKDQIILLTKILKKNFFLFNSLNDLKTVDLNKIHTNYKKLFSNYFYDPQKINYLNLELRKDSIINNHKIMQLLLTTHCLKNIIETIKIKNISSPTLIIHGKQDLIPERVPKTLNNIIENSNLIYLDQCGHFPYIEQSNKFLEIIKLFLNN